MSSHFIYSFSELTRSLSMPPTASRPRSAARALSFRAKISFLLLAFHQGPGSSGCSVSSVLGARPQDQERRDPTYYGRGRTTTGVSKATPKWSARGEGRRSWGFLLGKGKGNQHYRAISSALPYADARPPVQAVDPGSLTLGELPPQHLGPAALQAQELQPPTFLGGRARTLQSVPLRHEHDTGAGGAASVSPWPAGKISETTKALHSENERTGPAQRQQLKDNTWDGHGGRLDEQDLHPRHDKLRQDLDRAIASALHGKAGSTDFVEEMSMPMEEDAGKMSTPVHTLYSPLSHKQQQLREGHDIVESAMGARGNAVSGNNGVGVNYNFLDDNLAGGTTAQNYLTTGLTSFETTLAATRKEIERLARHALVGSSARSIDLMLPSRDDQQNQVDARGEQLSRGDEPCANKSCKKLAGNYNKGEARAHLLEDDVGMQHQVTTAHMNPNRRRGTSSASHELNPPAWPSSHEEHGFRQPAVEQPGRTSSPSRPAPTPVHQSTVLVPAGFTHKQGRGFGVQCPTTGTFTRGPPAGARHKLPNGACHPGEQMKHPPCLWLNSAVISQKKKFLPKVHRFVVRFGEGSAASEVDAVGFALGGAHQLGQQLAAFYFGRDRVRTAATETRMKNKPPFVGITLSRAGDLIIRKADGLERREVWSLDWYKQIVAHAGEPVFVVDVDLARRELAFGLFLQQGKEKMQKSGGNKHEDSECGGPSCRPLEPAMGGLRLGRDDRMKSGHQDDVLAGLGPQVAFESVAWGAGQPGWQSSSIALDRGALVASLKNGGASVRIINHVEIDRETATRSLGATRFWNGGVARHPEAFLSGAAGHSVAEVAFEGDEDHHVVVDEIESASRGSAENERGQEQDASPLAEAPVPRTASQAASTTPAEPVSSALSTGTTGTPAVVEVDCARQFTPQMLATWIGCGGTKSSDQSCTPTVLHDKQQEEARATQAVAAPDDEPVYVCTTLASSPVPESVTLASLLRSSTRDEGKDQTCVLAPHDKKVVHLASEQLPQHKPTTEEAAKTQPPFARHQGTATLALGRQRQAGQPDHLVLEQQAPAQREYIANELDEPRQQQHPGASPRDQQTVARGAAASSVSSEKMLRADSCLTMQPQRQEQKQSCGHDLAASRPAVLTVDELEAAMWLQRQDQKLVADFLRPPGRELTDESHGTGISSSSPGASSLFIGTHQDPQLPPGPLVLAPAPPGLDPPDFFRTASSSGCGSEVKNRGSEMKNSAPASTLGNSSCGDVIVSADREDVFNTAASARTSSNKPRGRLLKWMEFKNRRRKGWGVVEQHLHREFQENRRQQRQQLVHQERVARTSTVTSDGDADVPLGQLPPEPVSTFAPARSPSSPSSGSGSCAGAASQGADAGDTSTRSTTCVRREQSSQSCSPRLECFSPTRAGGSSGCSFSLSSASVKDRFAGFGLAPHVLASPLSTPAPPASSLPAPHSNSCTTTSRTPNTPQLLCPFVPKMWVGSAVERNLATALREDVGLSASSSCPPVPVERSANNRPPTPTELSISEVIVPTKALPLAPDREQDNVVLAAARPRTKSDDVSSQEPSTPGGAPELYCLCCDDTAENVGANVIRFAGPEVVGDIPRGGGKNAKQKAPDLIKAVVDDDEQDADPGPPPPPPPPFCSGANPEVSPAAAASSDSVLLVQPSTPYPFMAESLRPSAADLERFMADPRWSKGSTGHPVSCNNGCKYIKKPRGCKDGPDCNRCHFCGPPKRLNPMISERVTARRQADQKRRQILTLGAREGDHTGAADAEQDVQVQERVEDRETSS